MQYSYDKSFPGTVSSLSDIDIRTVGNIRKENGEPVYKQINAYNIYQKKQERILKK